VAAAGGGGGGAAVGFFCLFSTRVRPREIIHGEIMYSPILPAVRAVAACCKRLFALRPGLPRKEVKRTKEMTKERGANV